MYERIPAITPYAILHPQKCERGTDWGGGWNALVGEGNNNQGQERGYRVADVHPIYLDNTC